MLEFTGERIIPGQVDPDLLNEHQARYLFASLYAQGKRCLDAGCGVGYGAARLARLALHVTAVDCDPAAINEARTQYPIPNLHFQVADVSALPFPDSAFDLIVSFEVLEHLENWPAFLQELRRVCSPQGHVLISTPNRDYYTRSRGESGPNPFHHHEFTHQEFRAALDELFPSVQLFTQNHSPAVSIHAITESQAELLIDPQSQSLEEAQFFLAICGSHPAPTPRSLVYLPTAGNVLFERERHIQLLQEELQLKSSWLASHQQELARMVEAHALLQNEHDERSAWAMDTIANLEAQNRELAQRADASNQDLARAVDTLHRAEETVKERTDWARKLDAEIHDLYQQRSGLLAQLEELRAEQRNLAAEHREMESRLYASEHRRRQELQTLAEFLRIPTMDPQQDVEVLFGRVKDAMESTAQTLLLVEHLRASRWLRIGRILGVGPDVESFQPR